MAVGVNLSRDTKLYFTTNTDVTGYGDHNTVELQVLNGYTFSQGSDQQTIQINEAGATPNRGQRSFNTKLNPVDWKFSTYIRPKYLTATANTATAATTSSVVNVLTAGVITHAYVQATLSTGTITASGFYKISGYTNTKLNSATAVPVMRWGSNTVVRFSCPITETAASAAGTGVFTASTTLNTCPEYPLWNALAGNKDIFQTGTLGPAWVHGTATGAADASVAILQSTGSNVHQLAPFALIFKVGNIYYKVSQCALNMAEINFGIDQIAQVSWSGFGTTYTTVGAAGTAELAASVTAYDSTAQFITNKLSTVSLGSGLGSAYGQTSGAVSSATKYNVPITGGTISINNNLTYLTPENLGVVNSSIGYFTGTRAVSGNLTAYLRSGGTTETSDLLTAVVTAGTDNSYSGILSMGGANYPHVEFMFDGMMLQVPSVDVQDVVSTTINFTGQGTTTNLYDILAANEFKVRYLAA